MRKVRCVSPHAGARHGIRADNGHPAREGYKGALATPPHPGGYVDNAVLGRVPFDAVVDAPDAPAFIADGFHFVVEGTGKGDECAVPGDGCWCGRHRYESPPAAAVKATPAAAPAAPAGEE